MALANASCFVFQVVCWNRTNWDFAQTINNKQVSYSSIVCGVNGVMNDTNAFFLVFQVLGTLPWAKTDGR